ncbi:DEAD/DEAH box helicase family protein [Sphingomonas sp. CFBP 13714]|uniref:DEAD/DEAH box helicase family protein n=1 Tax=Sphingomonas sp. CFBP 13714 TaxID=2775308 RepID=UPI00177F34D5|nr:DEAD/DEAH box helicase family protein [Sphingomonas sp. CFBP 13714]MBD8699265.1 DEAD/DEAH box helicase family protein [Sphingomonas sp. CFBP 13714]
MKNFYYQPGPAGSGKTYQLSHWAVEKTLAHEKVLIAQPTKELIRETIRAIRAINPDIAVKQITGTTTTSRVTHQIVQHMAAAAPHAGEILIISHDALKRLPTGMRKFWHLVCDEIPNVLEHIDLYIAKTHRHITDHMDASQDIADDLIGLRIGNRAGLEAVQANSSKDQNIGTFNRLVNTLLSGEHLVSITRTQWTDLLTNPDHTGNVDFFAVLLSGFVEGYRTTTFMGANIEQTELYLVWSALLDVAWTLHPEMGGKLRYQSHGNGARLSIGYLFDSRLSKRFLSKDDEEGETVFTKVTDYVARFWDGVPFLWQANKDAMPGGFEYDARLPGVSHGLDKAHWKRFHNVALLSALNRKSAAYGFLSRIGVDEYAAQASLSWQNDYQAMMRCSLRAPEAIAPVRVIVGSKAGAEWLADKFPGCVVEKMETSIAEPGKSGRPAMTGDTKPMTGAERVRLSRARKKAGAA